MQSKQCNKCSLRPYNIYFKIAPKFNIQYGPRLVLGLHWICRCSTLVVLYKIFNLHYVFDTIKLHIWHVTHVRLSSLFLLAGHILSRKRCLAPLGAVLCPCILGYGGTSIHSISPPAPVVNRAKILAPSCCISVLHHASACIILYFLVAFCRILLQWAWDACLCLVSSPLTTQDARIVAWLTTGTAAATVRSKEWIRNDLLKGKLESRGRLSIAMKPGQCMI